MIEYNPIVEANDFINLEKYNKKWKVTEGNQTERGVVRVRYFFGRK